MSKDAKNVPALRFKGYSDAWEKRKLREITEINPKGKIPEVFRYVDLESVKNSSIISSKIETKQTAPSRAQRTAEIGDVFYQTVRPYQKNNVIFLLHSSMPYVFSTGYAQLRSNMNSFFILYLVQTDGFVNDVLNRATGTSYPAINPTHLATIIVCFPKIVSEQNRIGQVLEHLDNLITATQHKIDALEQAKKALLQRLFDQSWRFKGYSDPWEKRKLGELMKVTSVKRVHQSDWRQEGVPFLRARDIVAINKNQKVKEPIYISRDLYERYSEQSGRVTPGDLLVTGVGSIGIPFLIKTESPIYFKDGNIIWFQNRTLDPAFFYFQFTGNSIQTYILSTSGKGTVGTFTIATGKQTPIVFPKKTEQKLIGSTMSDLDNLIAATQSRLSSLELLKKALLQVLFI